MPKPGVNRSVAAITTASRTKMPPCPSPRERSPAAQLRARERWAWAQATATSLGGTSTRLMGVNSPEAETIAVSSRRQRVQTKRTSCGDADQLDRFTLAAIGQASQCEHDTRNRPGSSMPIPSNSASCPLPSIVNPCKSFRCHSTARRNLGRGSRIRVLRRSAQRAPSACRRSCTSPLWRGRTICRRQRTG